MKLTKGLLLGTVGITALTTSMFSHAGMAPCPDGDERLPGTGLCKVQALEYIERVNPAGPAGQLPDGCQWTVNEGMFIDRYLIYRAAQCNGKAAELEGGAGAHAAHVSLLWSALANAEADDEIVRIISLHSNNPDEDILNYAMGPNGRNGCKVRSDDSPDSGWPPGRLVIDDKPEGFVSNDGPRSACGEYGYSEDEASHWRIVGDEAWFLKPSQDLYQDVDITSLTILEQASNGGWGIAADQLFGKPSRQAKQDKSSAKPQRIASKSTGTSTSDKPERIKFARGAYSALVTGKLDGFDSEKSYVIGVGKGQSMTVEQVDNVDDHYVSAYLTAPDGSDANDLDASCHSSAEVSPTKAGDYTIKVTECQKADPWKGSFSLKVTIK